MMPSPTANPPDSGEVRFHLEKILASRAFSNASIAQHFLRFVIEETLAGRASGITEPVVAAKVFNLSAKFDRRNNSIVRAEATYVRRRLHDYYTGTGGSDVVIIDLPRGAHRPVIRTVASGGSEPPRASRSKVTAWTSWFPSRKGPPES
jgi:hypothetical protein